MGKASSAVILILNDNDSSIYTFEILDKSKSRGVLAEVEAVTAT